MKSLKNVAGEIRKIVSSHLFIILNSLRDVRDSTYSEFSSTSKNHSSFISTVSVSYRQTPHAIDDLRFLIL